MAARTIIACSHFEINMPLPVAAEKSTLGFDASDAVRPFGDTQHETLPYRLDCF
jgi:hypothetical protein